MGLLRSLADVVLIGAGTVRSDSHGRWVAASVHPATAAATAAVRAELGLAPNPTTVVVTAAGDLDENHPGLSDPAIPVLIVTTDHGAARLERRNLAEHVEVAVAGDARVDPAALIDVLGRRGAELVLCEGGPHLIGELFGARLVDELFLTVAPQLAGRGDGRQRLGLIEGREFPVGDAPWAELIEVRSVGSHMFTRYRFTARERNQ